MTLSAIPLRMRTPALHVVAGPLVGAGVAAAVVLAAVAVRGGLPTLLAPGLLPLTWLVAGAVALRARPGHAGAMLIALLGVLHLAAFALTAVLDVGGVPPGWSAWAVSTTALVLFSCGFAAIGTLLANYPDGIAPSRWFPPAAFGCAVVAVLLDAVTHERLPSVLSGVASPVAPEGLPIVVVPWSVGELTPLLAVMGAGMLVARGRRAEGSLGPRLTWAVAAGGTLALLLLATPAASMLFGDLVWSVTFMATAAIIPFVLVAGMVGYRLVDVDRLVGQALARGGVLVLAISCYAAAVVVGGNGPVSAVVVIVTVLASGPLVRRLERMVDRRLTGGRVRGSDLVHHLVAALESSAPGQVAQRTADTVAAGLAVDWVRVVLRGGTSARSRSAAPDVSDAEEPALVVALNTGTATVGRIECGPRRGGWSEWHLAQLRLLTRHAALTLHASELSDALARQVEQLHASRVRLVQAEQRVRRQLERDLHDGVQQQLVALLTRLGALEVLMEPGSPGARFVTLAKQQAEMSLAELRELIRGIHPPLLADRGLVAALRSRAALLPLRTEVVADAATESGGLTPETETAAYYVASEALTNVIKHARASAAEVELRVSEGLLVIDVRDDGVGMQAESDALAGPPEGHGLAGLRDRVEALGGRITTTPRVGGGTTLTASLPVGVGA